MGCGPRERLRHVKDQGTLRDLTAQTLAATFPQSILSLERFGTDDDLVVLRFWAGAPEALPTSGNGITVTREIVRTDGSGLSTRTFDDGTFELVSQAELIAAFNAGRACRASIELKLASSFRLVNTTDADIPSPQWMIETAGSPVVIADARRTCP